MLLCFLLAVLGLFQRTPLEVTLPCALCALLPDTEGNIKPFHTISQGVLCSTPCRRMLFLQDQVRSHEDETWPSGWPKPYNSSNLRAPTFEVQIVITIMVIILMKIIVATTVLRIMTEP